jgi:2-iminobutanoate/2-iminopropanoate deaminase
MKRRNALIALGGLSATAAGVLSGQAARSPNMKKAVKTDKAPQAIGPYSQAIIANGFVFCSGQIPIAPETNALLKGPIEEQTRQVLKNVAAVLAAAGSSFDEVVKSTVFLQDMNDFAAMNKIYGETFKEPFPARSTVQAARLPRDVKIEIEVVALVK